MKNRFDILKQGTSKYRRSMIFASCLLAGCASGPGVLKLYSGPELPQTKTATIKNYSNVTYNGHRYSRKDYKALIIAPGEYTVQITSPDSYYPVRGYMSVDSRALSCEITFSAVTGLIYSVSHKVTDLGLDKFNQQYGGNVAMTGNLRKYVMRAMIVDETGKIISKCEDGN